MKVGILALQGDFCLHKNSLDNLNVKNIYVRNKEDLYDCNALIIPGGESTTMSLLIKSYKLYKPIMKFSKKNSLFGTCAGAILMSRESNDKRIINFGCVNVETNRNSWGRQIDSFNDEINLSKEFKDDTIVGSFIRAPKFNNFGADCRVLGKNNDEIVLIRNDMHLISSFHPEINQNNLSIHEYFLNMINE